MMGKAKLNKKYLLIAISVAVLIMAIIYISTDTENEPFDAIKSEKIYVDNIKLISAKETASGTLIYSAGQVNDNRDNMYFADMVKKSLRGYKWLGGGGHINYDQLREDGSFLISAQLLNENQKIVPTLFGIFSDDRIDKVSVQTRDGSSNAVVYDGIKAGEKMYAVNFEENVSDFPYFILIVQLKDGTQMEYTVTDDNLQEFQKGHQIYFKEAVTNVEDIVRDYIPKPFDPVVNGDTLEYPGRWKE